jgi:hypothetical protein
MGAAGSRVANAGQFAAQEAYWRGAKGRNFGRRTHEQRLRNYAGKKINALDPLHTEGLSAEARARNAARAEKAQAAAALWAARRQRLRNAASRVASATRKGAAAAAGAVATGVGALGAGVGAAGSFLGRGARAAYNKAASQTRKAYQGLRDLSLKRRAKNFFFGKVKLTNADRALAQARGLNPNSTEFRKLLANRGAAGRPGSVAANKSARALEREGGLGRKVASLTRKAKAGLAAAAAAAGRGAAAAKNAVTKKASNWYAYGRNMVKYGRRRDDVERLASARKRAGKAVTNALAAIPAGIARNALVAQRAANAKKAAEAAAAARDEQLKKVQAGLTAAADKMSRAATAAASGAGAAAAGLAGAALAGIRGVTQKARNLGGAAAGALGALGRAASTVRSTLSSNSAHKRGSAARQSLFGRRPNNNKGGNSAPKPSALRAATAKLRTASSAVGTALRAAPGKMGSALATAGSAVAGAVVAAGTAVRRGASAATRSARAAGSSLANAIRYRVGALGNAATFYSMSLARRKQASANRRAKLNNIVGIAEVNESSASARPRSASARPKAKTD